jgi:hypothetical protein
MKRVKKLFKNKPHIVLSIPAILCAITFCTNLYSALTDGKIDANELSNLLATADGFETVVLFFVMVALRNKKP